MKIRGETTIAKIESIPPPPHFAQNHEATDKFFCVGKRLALYLARVSPQPTIDGLVWEVSQQLHEEDSPLDGYFSAESNDPPLEFQGLTRSLSVTAQGGRAGLLLGEQY